MEKNRKSEHETYRKAGERDEERQRKRRRQSE